MLKEKREKNKNAGESKNKSGSSNSSQSSAGSESSTVVKEEKADSGDCGANVKKETENRKSSTPVKSEPGSGEKKEIPDTVIKSEVRSDEVTSPHATELPNVNVKQENDGGGEGEFSSGQGQSQQPPQNATKQCNNAEYMQQQSQIFVFSTKLANSGAEAVMNGQFQSIIAYHCAQPGTKEFLKKHPLKMAQFNRNPNQWMTNMNPQKNKQQMMRGGMGVNFKPQPISNISSMNNQMSQQQQQQHQHQHQQHQQQQQQSTASFLNPTMDDIINGSADDIVGWDQTGGNLSLDSLAQNGDTDVNNLLDGADHFLGGDNQLNDGGGGGGGSGGVPMNAGMSPNFGPHNPLHGIQVSDEKLTPEQRQHRENQLNRLHRLQKMFFPDHHDPSCPHPDMQGMNHQHPENCGMKMSGPMGSMGGPMGGMGMQQNFGGNLGGMGSGPPMPNPRSGYRGMNPMGMCMNDGGPPPMGGPMDGMNCGPQMGMRPMDSPALTGQMSGGMMMPKGGGGGPHPQNMQMEMYRQQQQMSNQQQQQQQQMRPEGMPMGGGAFNKKLPPGQGPPPPYHQTARSASVPIATQSPNPGSPNNPSTSNPMSLPSPRAYSNSNMNSPADASRLVMPPNMKSLNAPGQSPSHDSPASSTNVQRTVLMSSNPSTPMSAHLSPSTSLKDASDGTTNNEGKEPNLMPVPSPQQIQYLNTFEGQELTIQKQPNTGVKDSPPGSAEKKNSGGATPSYPNTPSNPGSNQNTPNLSTNFPVPSSPSTTVNSSAQNITSNSEKGKAAAAMTSSPTTVAQLRQTPVSEAMQQQQHQQQQQSNAAHPTDPTHLFPVSSPGGFPGPGNGMPLQGKPNFENCPPGSQFPPCSRSDNVPINPTSIHPVNNQARVDPISSLAQMSQSLTSGGPAGMANPAAGMMGGGMNPQAGTMMSGGGFNNVMQGDMMGPDCGMSVGAGGPGGPIVMGDCGPMGGGQFSQMGPMGPMGPRSMSPKLGGAGGPGMPPNFGPGGMPPRMVGRPPQMGGPGIFNGANVQVKPGASNTIQYLPPRHQMGAQNPRGPPNIEFLSRFAGPMNPNPNAMVDNMPPRMQGMQYFQPNHPNFNPGGPGPMMDGDMPDMPPNMGGQGGMIQMMRPRGPLRMPMGGPGGQHFNAGPPNSNPFGPKIGPDGQPLPPTGPGGGMPGMQGGNFGPGRSAANDPNYAQQFHNFQQQLYATNTRGQLSQHSFFAPNK